MTDHLRIIFVCSGNICRSPMAESLAKHILDERGQPAVVISAGTLGLVGRKPASFARSALQEIDVEPPETRSQGISPALMEHAEYIAVMEPKHEEAVVERAPALEEKIVRLWDYAEADLEGIDDPVGENLESFRQTRELLYECLTNWFDRLLDTEQ